MLYYTSIQFLLLSIVFNLVLGIYFISWPNIQIATVSTIYTMIFMYLLEDKDCYNKYANILLIGFFIFVGWIVYDTYEKSLL